MSPTSARLMDEVATEANRARAAALLELAALERFCHAPQHRALLEREKARAEALIAALHAARVRSFFLGAIDADAPFEGSA